MFQIMFKDDEHTALDGTYLRVMRTRKWVYAFSSLLYVVVLDLYYPDKITGLLSVIYVPHFVLYYFAIGSSIVVSVQYFVLLAQLLSIYDIILRSRFAFRREEELSKAKEKLEAAAIKLRDYGSPFVERWKNELENKRVIINKWESKLEYYAKINQKVKNKVILGKKKIT